MKKLLITGLFAALFAWTGCDKPSPVGLENPDSHNEDAAVIEVLSSDPGVNNAPYSFDTTAYFRPDAAALRVEAALFIAKNKIIRSGNSLITGLAEFYAFDRTKPVVTPRGDIITYKTKPIDFFRIGLYQGRETMHKVRFRNQGSAVDTLLGPKYRIFGVDGGEFPNNFVPDYSDDIDVMIKPDNRPMVQFSVTPVKEVAGTVYKLSNGEREVIKIEWNGTNSGQIEILLGARLRSTDEGIALFRIRTADDGSYIIPRNLIGAIPIERFKEPSVTLIRRNEKLVSYDGVPVIIITMSNCSIRIGS